MHTTSVLIGAGCAVAGMLSIGAIKIGAQWAEERRQERDEHFIEVGRELERRESEDEL